MIVVRGCEIARTNESMKLFRAGSVSETEERGRRNRESNRNERSKQVMFKSIAGHRTARVAFELVVDRTHMGIDRMQTEDEPLGSVRIGHALCQQAQHLHLPCRQASQDRPDDVGESSGRNWLLPEKARVAAQPAGRSVRVRRAPVRGSGHAPVQWSLRRLARLSWVRTTATMRS